MDINDYIKRNFDSLPNYYKKFLKNEIIGFKAFMISCIIESNVGVIFDIIEKTFVNVNRCDCNKNNGLIIASGFNNNIEIIKFLLNVCNINEINKNGDNAFTFACKNNVNVDIIKLLCDSGINLNIVNKCGDNALTILCDNNSTKFSNFSEGLIINEMLSVIKYFIEDMGIDVDQKNHEGNNCLMLTCKYEENFEIVKYLCEISKDLFNFKNKNGDNAIFMACYFNNNLNIIRYLAEGFLVDTKILNKFKDNLFTYACQNNKNKFVLKYLAGNLGINIKHANINGYNGFVSACRYNNNLIIIKCLVEEICADVGHKSLSGWTGINYVYSAEIIKYLIEGGYSNINELKCELNNEVKNYMIESGYIVFVEDVKNVDIIEEDMMAILNIKKFKKISKVNVNKVYEFIIKYGLKGHILNKKLILKLRYDQLLILINQGIKIEKGIKGMQKLVNGIVFDDDIKYDITGPYGVIINNKNYDDLNNFTAMQIIEFCHMVEKNNIENVNVEALEFYLCKTYLKKYNNFYINFTQKHKLYNLLAELS